MWFNRPFFHYTCALLLILLVIYFAHEIGPFLSPIKDFIATIFTPVFIAGLLYYLLRPVVRFLEDQKIPRGLAILFVYACIVVIITIISIKLYPTIAKQIGELLTAPSKKLEAVKERTVSIISIYHLDFYTPVEVDQFVSNILETFNIWIKQNIADILSKITRFAVVFAFTPFILFYLLKDDNIFYIDALDLVPKKYRHDAENLLNNMDSTLSTFINGQLFVAFVVGMILFAGFLVIDLEYALPLAMFGMVLNTIPFIGPFIAIAPALLVGWSVSPIMALKVIAVMLVAHVMEANLISPQIIGQRLNIHPLTIVLLLLACGSLYGMLGLLLATPVYALCKVIGSNIWTFYTLRKGESLEL